LTTGRLPFPVDSEGGDPLPPLPKSLNPQLPQALSQAIMTALAPSPEDRFPTGKDFVAGLMPIAAPAEAGEEDVAMPTPSPEELEWKTDPESAAVSERYEFSSNGSGSQDGDWVTIAAASPSLRSLNQRLMTIGRDTASDIFLDAPTVSMRHAALRRTREGWEVLDLDSTNGVFLDGTRLLPEVGERWLQHQTLRIGPFFLGLQMTEREHGEPASAMALNATLSPVNVKLRPGEREEVWIMLQNLTTERGYYQILLEDLPYGWFDLPKDVLQLSPGEQSELTLAIQPPRMGEVTPTIQKYKVLVRSMVNGDILARMAGSIEVRPVSTFALDWFPDELENQGVTRLVIHNQGNAAFDYRIVAISPDAPLLFGQMEAPPVETKPPRRRQLKMPKRIRGPRMPRFLMLIPGISVIMLRLNSLPFLRSARMVQSSTRRYSSLGTRISRSAGQSGGSAASAPPERAEHAYSAPTNKLPRKQRLEPEIDLNVEIPPGERRAVDIAIAAASRPLISAGEIIPFELRVLLDGGPSQSALSTISTTPRIPLWLSRLLFFLLVVGLIAAGVYGAVNFCRNNEDTCRLPFVSQPAPGQMEEHAEMLRLDEKAQPTPTPLAFPTATPSSQIALSTAVVTALSVADVDGSVSLNTVAISPTIWLGDDEDGYQYRAFISFDTSGLLPTMRLQQAEIRINRASVLGQPYARLGDVHMDVGPASGFGQDPALALADFMAPAQATNVVSLNRPGVNGEWLSGFLNESGLAAINRGGLTQFRLYFTLTHSMDLITDQLFLNSGNLEDPALHPQLILTYDEAP
jgi:pSer/pThr/pTyr-binding forkhead associated (FHA) protein